MANRTEVSPDLSAVFGPDPLTTAIRGKLKELVGVLVEGELEDVGDRISETNRAGINLTLSGPPG